MEDRIKEAESDIKEITRMIYKLSETQSTAIVLQQATTDNINKLTADMKETLRATMSCDVVFTRLDTLDREIKEFKVAKNKIIFLILGSVTLAILSLVVKGATI